MSGKRPRPDLVSVLVGLLAGIGGARLFRPRRLAAAGDGAFGIEAGRGTPTVPPSGEAMAAGFEPHDAKARDLGWIMAIFAVSAVLAVALMGLMLGRFHRADARREAGLSMMQRSVITPPEPTLQADPIGDIDRLKARQSALLHGYARIDATTARIPIERAMALVTGQSLDAHVVAASTKP
jgi:hypothetical protein